MRKHIVRFALLCTLALSYSASAQTAPASVNVTLGDITDTRTTGQFFAGLKVEFKLSGDAIFDAFGIGKPEFTVAKDDTGRSLLKEDKDDTMIWSLQARQRKSNNDSSTAELANPARKATRINLQGVIPVYAPSLDPAAIVTLPSIAAIYGKTMESKETEISLTVLDKASYEAFTKTKAEEKKMKDPSGGVLGAALGQAFGMGNGLRDNDIQFRVKDPHNHLVRFDVITADGKAMENSSRSKTSADGEDVYTYNFRQEIPKDAALKIYYATPKSLLKVPFDLEKVALP